MKKINITIIGIMLFAAIKSFSAAVYPEHAKGKLFIQNDPPALQFEC